MDILLIVFIFSEGVLTMNFRSLFLIILIVFVCAVPTLQVFPSAVPHGFIGAWTPGSYGSCPGVAHQQPALPIWVQIAFDRIATDDFAANYCSFLRQSNPLLNIYGPPKKHGVTKSYVIVVDPSITQERLKIELEKANRHFDPEIERQEKLKKERVEQASKEAERKREEARLAKIVLQEKLQQDAEKRAKEIEIAHKAQIAEALRLQEEIEKRRKDQLEEEQAALVLSEVKCNAYRITALPQDFQTHGGSCVMNNLGQIVGSIGSKAVFWSKRSGTMVLGLDAFRTVAYAINDKGFIAGSCYASSACSSCRTLLWDSNCNNILYGPQGSPSAINCNNEITVNMCLDQPLLWDPKENTIEKQIRITAKSNSKGSFLNQIKQLSMMNFTDLSLGSLGKTYLLLPSEGQIITGPGEAAFLNDNDEVVTMIEIRRQDKSYHAIAKWDKNRRATRSRILQTAERLRNYSYFSIIAFNNVGQVLIRAGGEPFQRVGCLQSTCLFLLTPEKN